MISINKILIFLLLISGTIAIIQLIKAIFGKKFDIIAFFVSIILFFIALYYKNTLKHSEKQSIENVYRTCKWCAKECSGFSFCSTKCKNLYLKAWNPR